MLEVSNLTRSYGSFKAVDSVSFKIQKGEIIGLLGHNGAGKTTIMKMISGYLEADTGDVSLDGVTLSKDTKKLQSQLGYLPESLPVYPEMSVAEYLDYAADLKGLKGNTKVAEIKRAIKATDLSEKLLAPIEILSRGYKQRVGVAQAILGQPKLLILDEPTNGLDPEQTQHMRKLIKGIAKKATVILSTHIMQEVNALCDRVLILKSGQLVLDEQLEALQHSKQLVVESDIAEAKKLSKIEGVFAIEQAPQKLVVSLEEKVNMQQVAANISKAVVESGAQLFAIYPQKRDLETVFNQINNDEFVANANNNKGGAAHAA